MCLANIVPQIQLADAGPVWNLRERTIGATEKRQLFENFQSAAVFSY